MAYDAKPIGSVIPGAGPVAVLVITLLVQVMVSAAVLAPAVIAPVIVRSLGLPVAALGIFISVVYISAICASLYSGTLIGKWGALRTSQVGLVMCACGLALVATGQIWAGLLGAALVGIGYGPNTPASSHILIRTTPPHRLATVFSIKQTGVPLGGILAGMTVPLQEAAFGWAWAICSISIGCVLMALIAQRLRAGLDGDRPAFFRQSLAASIASPIRLVLSHRDLQVLAACSFVFAGVQLSLSSYLSTYLNLDLGWTLLAAGFALSVMQVAGIAGRIMWGRIADGGLGVRRTLVLLVIVMTAGCIAASMFSADTNRYWIYAVLIVFGASGVGWNGVYLAEVARLAPQGKVGLATGGTLAFTYLGIVFWMPLFGLIAEVAGGYQLSYLSFCAPLLFCLGFLCRRSNR